MGKLQNYSQSIKNGLLAVLAVIGLSVGMSGASASALFTSTISTSSVSAGAKVDLTSQIPAVNSVDASTQEIVQSIDPTKVVLTGSSDVIAPSGWTVTYSTDGSTFSSTPASWGAVVKVKASGSVNSLGETQDGKQILASSVTALGTVTTVNGAIRTNGDGFDTEFDSRGYIFNTYHHNALNSSLDCRKRSDGSFCSASWPFALSTSGFYSNFASTQFFDEVNKHIWMPVSDRSTGTGFLCIDVSVIETPAFCGGSKATAWHMVQARVNALETGIYQIIASNGKIYSWDIQSPALLCYDYLSNNGLGASCSTPMPTFPHLSAGSLSAANFIPTTYTNFKLAFGNLYGQLNGVATCFKATTYAKCQGWADFDLALAANNSAMAMYLQPNSSGTIVGVCVTNDAKCFAADGTRFAANATIQNALINSNMARWRGSIETVGSKLLFNSIWDKPSYLYCYDYSTSAACAGWNASSSLGVSGVGEKLMKPSGSTSWRVYTIKIDPLSNDCLWTNGDAPSPVIGQLTISTATFGCNISVTSPTFTQSQLQTRLPCAVGDDLEYRKFSIGGLTAGTDYTSANITIYKVDGSTLVSGGTTWSNVAIGNNGSVDLNSISKSDLGQGWSIKVTYVGRTSTASSTGILETASKPAQLCLSVTAQTICPTSTIIGTPQDAIFSFSATAATISSTNTRTDYSATSGDLTVSAPVASVCGFVLKALAAQGGTSGAFPTSITPVQGVIGTLLDSTGTVVTGLGGQPVTGTTDASGNFSFGYVKAGTYKIRFADFPLVNGVGVGDVGAVYKSPYTYTTGLITQSPQNPVIFTTIQTPLDSPAVSGTAGGSEVVVKATYTMRAAATNDVVIVKKNATSTIDVLSNDTPTTGASFTTSSLKLCNTGTTTSCALTSLTVTGQGTYAVLSGKITFTPVTNYAGPVNAVTYSVADGFSNTPQTVYATLTSTVVPPATAIADTLSGNTLSAITVDVGANDVPATGTTIDKTTVKLCSVGTSTGCAVISVNIAGKGTYSVSNSGIVTFTPEANYVGAVPAITYSINDAAGNTSTSTVTATVTATPPTISTGAFSVLERGAAMTAATQSVTLGSGTIPASGAWTLQSGSLPNGVTLNANTGSISGTPTVTGTFTFTVQVTDSNGLSATKLETLTVYAAPIITTTPLTYRSYSSTAVSITNTVTTGSALLQTATGWSATGLPAGLSIDGSNGVISGAVATDGSYTIVVKALDLNGLFDLETITLTIVSKPIITTISPLNSAVINVPISTISQTKSQGTATIPTTGAWSILSGSLPLGLMLNANTGEITGTPTATGVFTWTVKLIDNAGEWSTKVESITVNSGPTITTDPLTYKLYRGASTTITNNATIGTSAIRSGTGWSVTGLPAGLSIDGSSGVITGTPATIGSYQVTIRATDVNGLYDEETLTLNVVTRPVITTSSPLTSAVLGREITPIQQSSTPGAASIPVSGAWTIISGGLPAGLNLNPNTGEITGTPTATGVFTWTVKLIDNAGEWSTKVESITVNSGPTITTDPLTYIIFTLNSSNIANTATQGTGALLGVGAWSATGLPQGISINASTGAIFGTPTTTGVSTVTVRVTDVNGLFDEQALTITVTLPVYGPTITTTPVSYKFGVNNPLNVGLDDFMASAFPVSQSHEISNTATKGTADIGASGAWSATSLPPGLAINANSGKITGTATAVGTYQTVVKVTDTAGRFSTKILTIDIVQGPENTTPLTYTYEVDIPKRIGLTMVTIPQTYTLGSAPLSIGRPVPFLVQGTKPAVLSQVNIVNGEIYILPQLAIVSKAGYGSYKFKTVIVDTNGAYDMVTFTINIVKAGTNVTTLTLPDSIANGTLITKDVFSLAGTSSKKLPVTFTVDTPKICAIDAATKKLKLLDAGNCSITASSGTGKLLSKDTKEFTITKLPQVASFVTPGEIIPGTLARAPLPTDDPAGFQLYGLIDTQVTPVYTSLDPNVCSVDASGVATWDADLTMLPKVESDFHCRIAVSHPGDFTHSAAPAQVITLDATHVEPPAPEGGIATDPGQVASLPASGGSTPMKGGNSFVVSVDKTKKTVTVSPLSKGRWIGPIYADIVISYTPKGSTIEETQICARNYFGIAVTDSKTKKIITPPLGGDPLVIPEMTGASKQVSTLIKEYQSMQGKFSVTKKVKGKKVVMPGYLDFKYFAGQATCVLNAKAYAAWKAGVQVTVVATVTRDRRWPTTYTRYKSYDWKNKSNNGIIYPTVVEWVIKVG